jgi:hypothetical protein
MSHSLRGLRSLPDPIIDSIKIQSHSFFGASGDRVEKPNALDKATVPAALTIRYCDVIERALLASASC